MGSNLNQVLANLGARFPEMFRQKRQDIQAAEDKKKTDELSRITTALKQGELEQQQGEAEMRGKGRQAVEEFSLGKGISGLPIARDYVQPLSDVERASKYNLRAYAPYEPAAKSIVEGIDKEAELKSKTGGTGGGANVWSQKTYKYTSDPNALPALKEQLKDFNTKGIIDNDTYGMLDRLSNTDPANAEMLFNKMVTTPKLAATTISAATPAKVQQKYELITPTAATTAATSEAGAIGKAKGETESNINAIPGFKPIEGTKITDESVKIVKEAAPIINNINKITSELINDIKQKGYQFTGDDAAKYNANVRYLQILAKSDPVFHLGVIAGPDMMLLDQIIADPSSLKQGIKSTVLGSIETRLKEFQDNMNSGAVEKYRAHGFEQVETKKKKVYNPQTNKFELR